MIQSRGLLVWGGHNECFALTVIFVLFCEPKVVSPILQMKGAWARPNEPLKVTVGNCPLISTQGIEIHSVESLPATRVIDSQGPPL